MFLFVCTTTRCVIYKNSKQRKKKEERRRIKEKAWSSGERIQLSPTNHFCILTDKASPFRFSPGNRFQMDRPEEIEESPAGPSSGSAKSKLANRADPFLVVCRCFSVVTSLIAILCVVVNVLAAVRSFRDSHDVISRHLSRCQGIRLLVVLIPCLKLLSFPLTRSSMEYSGVMLWWLLVLLSSLKQNGVSFSNFPRFISFVTSFLFSPNMKLFLILQIFLQRFLNSGLVEECFRFCKLHIYIFVTSFLYLLC